jgi:carbon starvation protein
MRALPLVLIAACTLAIAYRYYSAFLAAKALSLDARRPTPAHTLYDGHNYVPTNRWVLFGHHFAAITGAGPLIGPVLAAQFGFLPGFLWLVIGVCLAGAVHDFVILTASARSGGRSLAELALLEISPRAYFVTALAILFIVIIALAGLGLAVVNALHDSAWGAFTIGMSVPIALAMGLYMYRFRKGRIGEASSCCSPASCSGGTWPRRRRSPGCSRSTACRSRWRWRRTGSSRRCCPCGCCCARATTCRAS